MPKLGWDEIVKKAKILLFRIMNRKLLVFLIFLALSAAFWTIKSLNESYEREFSIPLRLQNVPDNIVITTELPQYIHVTLRDKGTVLYSYMFGKGFRAITLDFNEQNNTQGYALVSTQDISRSISAQLLSSSKLIGLTPDTLDYYYNYGQSKRVPVRLQGVFEARTQYYIAKTLVQPDSVTVYAIPQILDTIHAAYTVPLHYQNIHDTLTFNASLNKVRGAKFIPNTVQSTLYSDIYTEKSVEIPVVGVNFPASIKLRTFPSKVKVLFQVGMNQFKHIDAHHFVLTTSYEEIVRSGTNVITLQLKSIPEGAVNVRLIPDQVEFLMEQISE